MSNAAAPLHRMAPLVPPAARAVLSALEEGGYEAWLVGGWVRDALRGVAAHDIDIATNAPWQQTAQLCTRQGFAVLETGTRHGTVTVIAQNTAFEVTTFRTEGAYHDHRHPDEVQFVQTIEEDLARRDFTINAMAYHPERGLRDPHNGQADLARHVIRCVGNPSDRFAEDALRIVRGLRFASQLSFELEAATEQAAFATAQDLNRVAGERLAAELEQLLCGEAVRATLMRYVDILGVIIPPLLTMKGFDQHNRWHIYDVLEHTACVIEHTQPDPLARWAALFHDMGKPDTFTLDEKGIGHMYGHPDMSVEHLRVAAKRLHFSNKMLHNVSLLVRYHDDHPAATRKSVRKLFIKLDGDEHLFHVMCDLMRADSLGKAPFAYERTQLIDEVEALFNTMIAEERCFSLKDLPINGTDIMALGVAQGPEIGRILNALFDAVINEQIKAEHEELIAYAQTLIATSD